MKRILLFLLLFVNLQIVFHNGILDCSFTSVYAQHMTREAGDNCYDAEIGWYHSPFSDCRDVEVTPKKCQYCGTSFDTDLAVLQHEKDCSSKPKDYECSYCHSGFDDLSSLNTHENQCPERFKCYRCGNGFSSQYDLDNHTCGGQNNQGGGGQTGGTTSGGQTGGKPSGSGTGGTTPSPTPKISINIGVNLPENLKIKALNVLIKLKESNIKVTSGTRDLDKQLKTMLNNIKNTSVAKQKEIYSKVGDAIIDQYDPKKTDSENLANMRKKAIELGPDKLSKHIPNDESFAIDISKQGLSNPVKDRNDLEAMPEVLQCLDENGCLHIVIKK